MKLSPEFTLAVQCCRYCFRQAHAADDPILPGAIDWDRFLGLASFHRIEGLVWNALSRLGTGVPQHVEVALAKAAAEIAIQNLQSATKSSALLTCFNKAGVPLLFLKGSTLGALAYSNPGLKSAIDVDVLIDPADVSRSLELLDRCGFRRVIPATGSAEEWHRRSKESVWICDSPRLQLDLHTRTADNPLLISSLDVHSPRQVVDIGNGVQLPTFKTDSLFSYLAVHGASSAWFRLKWISDLAGLLHNRPGDELDRIFRLSQELGAARCAGQALLLADTLFSTLDHAPALRNELKRDRAIVNLYENALQFLARERGEPTARRLGTLTIHWTQFNLRPDLRFKASELSRQAALLVSRQR